MRSVAAPFFFVVLFIGLPIAAGVIAFLLMRRWAGKRTVCGKCSYLSEGLMVLRCPECGSDLREVGLLPIGIGLRWRTAAAVGAWALFAVVLFGAYYQQVIQMLPQVTIGVAKATLGGSWSGAFTHVDMQANLQSQTGWFDGEVQSAFVRWSADFRRNNNVLATLEVDPAKPIAVFRVGDKELREEGPLDADRLAAWIGMLIEKPYATATKAEAEQLLFIANDWLTSARSGFKSVGVSQNPTLMWRFSSVAGSYGGHGTMSAARGFVVLVFIVYVVLMLYIAWGIVRFGRQRLRVLVAESSAKNPKTSTAGIINAPKTPSPPATPGPRP